MTLIFWFIIGTLALYGVSEFLSSYIDFSLVGHYIGETMPIFLFFGALVAVSVIVRFYFKFKRGEL